jgi:4'-phosphopantetheinyl transferase
MRLDLAPWTTLPDRPVLETSLIHLWRFRLDLPTAEIDHLKPLLSPDELSRAGRLLDPLKSRSFVTARSRLRQILALYLDLPAEIIHFSYGTGGKPSLDSIHSSDLTFNLAHSGPWALVGVGKQHEIGVDLEVIDPELAFAKMAAQFFSANEFSRLTAIAMHRRRRTFYRIWTCKEAWLKSQGWGFSGPPDKMNDDRPGKSWQVQNFSVGRGCIGALSLSSQITSILRFDGF